VTAEAARIRAPIGDLAEGERVLPAETSRYLCRVLRLGAGARFVAFDPESRLEGEATVVDPSPDAARIRVAALQPARIVAASALVLVYGLAKGDKVDAVVRDATELGATRIVLARTERSIAKVDAERAPAKRDRWKRIAEEAARQCGRADPPAIVGALSWSGALDDAASACAARFCLDPRAPASLGLPLGDATAREAAIAVAIGPEGGLSADEIAIAIGKGFLPVSLGPFILRTETVAAAVLGAIRILSTR
jgi:16S rRNA (uracil1498-N3)-methyltransferase